MLRIKGKLLKFALTLITNAFNMCCYLLPPQRYVANRMLLLLLSLQHFENYFRLEFNNDLMSLHIGDRILEINGTPVKDLSLESVENLFKYSDSVLQVRLLRKIKLLLYY